MKKFITPVVLVGLIGFICTDAHGEKGKSLPDETDKPPKRLYVERYEEKYNFVGDADDNTVSDAGAVISTRHIHQETRRNWG